MMSLVFALLAVAAQAATDLPDARWEAAGSRLGFSYSFDPASVRPAGDRISFRIRIDGPIPSPAGAQTAIATIEVDCGTGMGAWTEGRFYNASGVLLETRLVAPAGRRLQAHESGTPEATIQRRACGARRASGG
jgi:hypothetical protein